MLFVAPDGKVWCFWTAQQTREGRRADWDKLVAAGKVVGSFNLQHTSIIRKRVSGDNGHTWGPIEVAFDRPGSFMRQRIVAMSNGEWIFPCYYSLEAGGWHGDDYTVMQISGDKGKTWTEYAVPNSRGRVHAAVIELSPGRLIAFFRSRAADRIYVSRSSDYGRTWSEPARTVLPNNNASIGAIKLASGPLAIIFNNCNAQEEDPNKTIWPKERYPVSIALSEDEGQTWPYMRHLDTGDGFTGEANKKLNRRLEYPMIFQSKDGLIHCTYSTGQRQCIKYVRISEAWIRDQAANYVPTPGDDLGPAQP
jgi:predicted neuraminidase